MENDETIPMERTAMKKTRFPLLILGATALLAACAENPYRGENAKTATGATINVFRTSVNSLTVSMLGSWTIVTKILQIGRHTQNRLIKSGALYRHNTFWQMDVR